MHRTSLSPQQIVLSGATGAILWYCAALLMHFIVQQDFYTGLGVAAFYTLIIPTTLPFVFLLQRLINLRNDQIAMGYTIATTAALLLDGIAFAFYPSLYAHNPTNALQAAAAILWGAGVGQVLALLINKETII